VQTGKAFTASDIAVLTLFTRYNCSLCDDMLYTLREFAVDLNFSIQLIDIDTDPRLVERYNDLVPVLKIGSEDICHHFLDRQALLQALETERTPH